MALAPTSSTSKGLLAAAPLTSAPFQPSSDRAPAPPPPKPSGAELAPKFLRKRLMRTAYPKCDEDQSRTRMSLGSTMNLLRGLEWGQDTFQTAIHCGH